MIYQAERGDHADDNPALSNVIELSDWAGRLKFRLDSGEQLLVF